MLFSKKRTTPVEAPKLPPPLRKKAELGKAIRLIRESVEQGLLRAQQAAKWQIRSFGDPLLTEAIKTYDAEWECWENECKELLAQTNLDDGLGITWEQVMQCVNKK